MTVLLELELGEVRRCIAGLSSLALVGCPPQTIGVSLSSYTNFSTGHGPMPLPRPPRVAGSNIGRLCRYHLLRRQLFAVSLDFGFTPPRKGGDALFIPNIVVCILVFSTLGLL